MSLEIKFNILEEFKNIPINSYKLFNTTKGLLCLWNFQSEERVGLVNLETIINNTFEPSETNFQWMELRLWKLLHQTIFIYA